MFSFFFLTSYFGLLSHVWLIYLHIESFSLKATTKCTFSVYRTENFKIVFPSGLIIFCSIHNHFFFRHCTMCQCFSDICCCPPFFFKRSFCIRDAVQFSCPITMFKRCKWKIVYANQTKYVVCAMAHVNPSIVVNETSIIDCITSQ